MTNRIPGARVTSAQNYLPVKLALAVITAAGVFSGQAMAEQERRWVAKYAGAQDSWVRFHEPTAPGAVASVTFHNTTVHSLSETFPLAFDGLAIDVRFEWQADGTQAERITVLPPPGYIAVPPDVTVDEDASDVIHIFEYLGG